ncbi:helix-turn-helix transcriptional regulator [Streptomyces sp. NPDC050617]|uniref:helix-turn-helix domain-containing protein n=1 Tax=Streptomyces sp. NPDC050617 TaxID=3154628 RepID=UPI003417C110
MAEEREVDGRTPRERFGDAVREHRELWPECRMTQSDLARRTRMSKSAISRIERAVPPIPSGLPALLDEIFGTDGTFKRLYDEIRADAFPVQYRQRMEAEPKAVAIAEWSPTVVPGLLQTAGYAHALFRAGAPRASDQELALKVGARLARQDVLRGSSPPDFSAIMCESVIRRNIGGRAVMRDQLASLLAAGAQHTNVLQVLPFTAETHGLVDGSMSILTGTDGATVVYTEGIKSGAIISESAAVRHLSRSYDVVTAAALSPEASARMIRELMEET